MITEPTLPTGERDIRDLPDCKTIDFFANERSVFKPKVWRECRNGEGKRGETLARFTREDRVFGASENDCFAVYPSFHPNDMPCMMMQDFTRTVIFSRFSFVTHDGLSDRGTTRSQVEFRS